MNKENLAKLTNEELLEEVKKRKSNFRFMLFPFGLLIGVAIINSLDKGTGIFTLMPVIFFPVLLNLWNKYQPSRKEKESRNLS